MVCPLTKFEAYLTVVHFLNQHKNYGGFLLPHGKHFESSITLNTFISTRMGNVNTLSCRQMLRKSLAVWLMENAFFHLLLVYSSDFMEIWSILSPWFRVAHPTVWQAYIVLFPALTTKTVNKVIQWKIQSNFDRFYRSSNQAHPDRDFMDSIILGIEVEKPITNATDNVSNFLVTSNRYSKIILFPMLF
jgi:hypothetical protein